MKKRAFSFILILAMMFSLCLAVQAEGTASVIKNIIYMIPDGGGYTLYDFADMVKQAGGLDSTKFPNKTPTEKGPMFLKDYLVGTALTASTSSVTDSAAAATALATGNKTVNGYVGIDRKAKPVANLVEAAQSVGKSTGLVSVVEWTHATPAGFSGHAITRSDYKNLYEQIENKGLDVVLGVGYGQYSQWATIQNATDRGYTVIDDKTELDAVQPGDNIWGNITQGNFGYDCNYPENRPSLAEMTRAAITAMSDDEDGFFLMVEGSLVDSGGHNNNALQTTSEYLAFDAAFKVAVDYAKGRTDTIVIATPDHDTGGMNLTEDMSAEVALVQGGTNPDTISWTTTGHTDRNVPVWMYVPEGVDVIEGLNPILGDTAETRESHIIDNTAIAPYLAEFMGVDLGELTEELFVDITNIGSYSTLTGRFSFNNGDKYVYPNQSVYYKDGIKTSMGFKEAIYVGGKMYAPAEIIDEEDWNYPTNENDGITGTGTADDPYIINSAEDYIEFAESLTGGEKYSGKYFKQTEDIDLAGRADFMALGKESTFAGTYNGDGHIINVDIPATVGNDKTVFPYLTGTLMNVGVTGKIANNGTGIGLVRSVRAGAKVVNCFSNAKISGGQVCGITWTALGTIENCSFGGTLVGASDAKEYAFVITATADAVLENNYYSSAVTSANSLTGVTAVDDNAAKSTLAATLNSGRSNAAATLGVSVEDISCWTNADGYPVHGVPLPTVTDVTVSPESVTLKKGTGVQLTATVTGENNPSLEVNWSIEDNVDEGTYVSDDGYLTISTEEALTSFTVMAKSKQDGSKVDICRVTVTDELAEPDGSRANPYIIADEEDFLAFTNAIIGGEKYTGKYFRQTANIDMSDVEEYNGITYHYTFDGIYDGGGYTINVDINSKEDGCIFPYLTGTVMNLSTTGTVNNGTFGAGICRSVRAGGKVINCSSTVDVTATSGAYGITKGTYGYVANCWYKGTLSANSVSEIGAISSGGSMYNNYFVGEEYTENTKVCEITEEQLGTSLTGWLNNGIKTAAETAGVAESQLKKWSTENGASELIWGFTKGDVNSNGKIDVYDGVLALKHIAGISSLSEKGRLAATGVFGQPVKVTDAVAILRYIARITSKI